MKINQFQSKDAERAGYALMMVMFFSAIGLMAVGGALRWTSTTADLTERNNQYYRTQAAAEAATEKVLSAISKDYYFYGEGQVYNNLSSYAQLVPTATEDSIWTDFGFYNTAGTSGRTYVGRASAWTYTNLLSQYTGLMGMAATYRIISNARRVGLDMPMTVAVRQDVQVASVPLFQFAMFYTIDLEVNPGAPMVIGGRVHGNSTIYIDNQAALTFEGDVTSADNIINDKSPLDPSSRSGATLTFKKEHDSQVSSLTLPIGTNNSPSAVRAVIEIPPAGESPTSLMGKQRMYNKSDLIIRVTNAGVVATSGLLNNFGLVIPATQVGQFLNTTVTFYDKREGKTMKTTEVDVAKLKTWSQTNTLLKTLIGRDLNALYIDDQRSQTSSTKPAIRLVNGQTLPNLGLTVTTPNPLYIKGHYNAPSAHLGTTNTTLTKPASIMADAITVLSGSWNDSNSSKSLSNRSAANTTVNAAFLSGIVPSNGSRYSGGVENFPRFLEGWGGKELTYNGSMVVMFPSEIATSPWGSSDVYGAPNRDWYFDLNFMDAAKLPPGTPQLSTLIRASWALIKADTVM
jgi:hypothetical protein